MDDIPKKTFLQIFLVIFIISSICFFKSPKSNNSETSFRKTLFLDFLQQIVETQQKILFHFMKKSHFHILKIN